jgi:hypothetical protein
MAANGVLGFGVRVAYSTTSPTTWIPIPQLTEIEFPSFEPDVVDTTVHGTNALKRSIRGMISVGEMTMTLLADLGASSVHRNLRQLQMNGTTVWWRIELPENRAMTSFVGFEFQGWVKDWTPEISMEDVQKLRVTVQFDGTDFTIGDPGPSEIS